ncbi:MAG: GIY-YIG nuclease family protein [Gordonia sp. (in: high G+C Gram-positive bacteria)]|uniref:GIY-YIG nuclease family protein n=1 Tax=Gordonia TaxID=2053 RepID=UPI0032632080
MRGYLYILRCADGSYYVGSTRDVDHRFEQHQSGRGARYTRDRRPVELVLSEEFESIEEAYGMEKRVQKWSRAKREALIAGDFGALHLASKKGFRPPRPPGSSSGRRTK